MNAETTVTTSPAAAPAAAPTGAASTVAVSTFRRFPIALYLFLFGGTGMGFGVGLAYEKPSSLSLIVMAISCAMLVAGYFAMRPYMRLAKQAIRSHATQTTAFKDKANDAVA